MRTRLGVPEGQEEATWRPLFQKYNQSLCALKAGGFQIQEDEYWDCLRAGAEDYLSPDKQVQCFSKTYEHRVSLCSALIDCPCEAFPLDRL